ncbi:MAG: site-specific DNA-methyltransferase [Ignavibacteriae bacterium]|nr:site-specific DNA-methyltransferase [Ignavibacteriota bacterium]
MPATDKTERIEHLTPTYTFREDRLEALRRAVPEAFADGELDWEALRHLLAEHLTEEEEESVEHFGLTWPGKRRARRAAHIRPEGTLKPAPGEGLDEETTRNLYIEGDNLEVLKLLQKSYAGKVKMIYIDPPYNTGNDFVYPDDYSQPVEQYLKLTGQKDDEGRATTTNPKSSGRFHSNWLNMMYPRLVLARELLAEDGVIFVSIDDNEVANLKLLFDEVFGVEQFEALISWQKRYTRSNNTVDITNVVESIVVYSKSPSFEVNLLPRTADADARYSNPDNDHRGPWKGASFLNPLSPQKRPNLCYPIQNPKTGQTTLPTKKAWRISKEAYTELGKEGRLYWGADGTNAVPSVKQFLSEARRLTPINFWSHDYAGNTDEGTSDLSKLILGGIFDNPKPIKLVKRVLEHSTSLDSLILDFFSGSSTTAQAVLELNREDGGNRRFIMVQLPEPTGNPEFPTIAEIGKERIRRVVKRMKEEAAESEEVKEKLAERSEPEDLGFRVFKLDRSNFRAWNPYEGKNTGELAGLFDQEPLVEGWKKEDLLTEILLQQGYPLDSTVEEVGEIETNQLLRVTCSFFETPLYISLDPKIAPETIEQLPLTSENRFICLDSALTDQSKVRLVDRCRLIVI